MDKEIEKKNILGDAHFCKLQHIKFPEQLIERSDKKNIVKHIKYSTSLKILIFCKPNNSSEKLETNTKVLHIHYVQSV